MRRQSWPKTLLVLISSQEQSTFLWRLRHLCLSPCFCSLASIRRLGSRQLRSIAGPARAQSERSDEQFQDQSGSHRVGRARQAGCRGLHHVSGRSGTDQLSGADTSEHRGFRRYGNGSSSAKCTASDVRGARGPKPNLEADIERSAAAFEHEHAPKELNSSTRQTPRCSFVCASGERAPTTSDTTGTPCLTPTADENDWSN